MWNCLSPEVKKKKSSRLNQCTKDEEEKASEHWLKESGQVFVKGGGSQTEKGQRHHNLTAQQNLVISNISFFLKCLNLSCSEYV